MPGPDSEGRDGGGDGHSRASSSTSHSHSHSHAEHARSPRRRPASVRRPPGPSSAPSASSSGSASASASGSGTPPAPTPMYGSGDAFPARPAGAPASATAAAGPSALSGPHLDAPFQPARAGHIAHVRGATSGLSGAAGGSGGGSGGGGSHAAPLFAPSTTAPLAFAPPPDTRTRSTQAETSRAPARRRHTVLDSIDTSAPLGTQHPASPHRDAYATSSQFSPAGPSDGYRRRLSNPHGPHPVHPRKLVGDDEPPLSARLPLPPPTTSLAWLSGGAATRGADVKHNKSDDEREVTDDGGRPPGMPPSRRRAWWAGPGGGGGYHPVHGLHAPMPSISMTPPSSTAMAFAEAPPIPLPLDPNNLLPLSSANSPSPSPAGSAMPTPFHSPRTSITDLAAEYAAGMGAAAAGAAAAGTGHPASPRTSMSTSSSRFGWATGRTWSESSRSGEDDESSSPTLGKQWWPRRDRVLVPAPSPITTAPRSRLAPRLVATRRWGWLLDLLGASTEKRRGGRLVRSARQRNREKERLVGAKARSQTQATWPQRVWAFVPTRPTTIILFLFSFALFALGMYATIKHILNPDKEALPWRSYCSSSHPTLYSLQDPHAPAPHLVGADFTSPPAHRSSPVNSFSSSPATPVLAPVGPAHALWPYAPALHAPFAHDLAGELLDGVEPVGVLIGVMTTDAGVERRNYIRQSYASHWRSRTPGTEGVRVRFVMGRPRAKYRHAVELENEAFNDILFLDIPENMNSGKTHAFFSWAAANATVPDWTYDGDEARWLGEKKPDYVVKADEDSFIMLGELERRLRAAPRTKAYWGYLVKNLFMAGECYALSFDLVEYIAASPALRTLTRGKEDKLVSRWMRMHPARESILWVAERCWIYDHPKAGTVYSHGFLFPAEVDRVRREHAAGVEPAVLALRGGPDGAPAYSSVSRFGARYVAPARDLSAVERVEALVEGSPLSLLRDEHAHGAAASSAGGASGARRRERIRQLAAARPGRAERYLGDPRQQGGTVVVHYIKRQEWWIETMVALLGTADEYEPGHGSEHGHGAAGAARGGRGPTGSGVGAGLGMLEWRDARVVGGSGGGGHAGVRLEKELGL